MEIRPVEKAEVVGETTTTRGAAKACSLPGCEGTGTFVCSRCKVARYCCAEHQREAWSEHKALCVKAQPLEPAEESDGAFEPKASVSVSVNPPPADPTLVAGGQIHTECPEYCELANRALAIKHGDGFADIVKLDVFRLTGPDNWGRPVFLFIPEHLPDWNTEAVVERFSMYVVSVIHDVVVRQEKDYTIIWCCNNSGDRPLKYRWWKRIWNSMPYQYHEHLQSLCIVHPSLSVRMMVFALSYLPTKHDFWNKINFADRLEFLDQDVPVALIKKMPKHIKEYDKELDREMYRPKEDPIMPAGMGMPFGAGFGSMSGGMGGLSNLSHLSGIPGLGGLSELADLEKEKLAAMPKLPPRNWER
jgi:hypothetical protein